MGSRPREEEELGGYGRLLLATEVTLSYKVVRSRCSNHLARLLVGRGGCIVANAPRKNLADRYDAPAPKYIASDAVV
jgi:hypothetical protein